MEKIKNWVGRNKKKTLAAVLVLLVIFLAEIGSSSKSPSISSPTENVQLSGSEQAFCAAFAQYLAIAHEGLKTDAEVLAGLSFFVEKGKGTSFEVLTQEAWGQATSNDTVGLLDTLNQIGVRCGVLND